ncbi:anthranilate phosphoribosyltransferase [Tamilnaduibacter salinus]|uniref:Anthranilate phosphoribosyltransferase n=1 Tax=Tamilnaduibacter salinus TaxID=1484056 RepID=A0A2A2I3T5_9GAMM|nr:glycosyl transferase family protein [Tamilnaduibacter salinus]PAV26379.1 glycosyl transferase [Tamilnaduibacter salinus]PVY78200.1 anthranilate phosphoribosyltransferase [Tamilnaduibacter salinus]
MATEHDELPQPFAGEHPFAPYVRILGRGRHGSRSLSRAEARHAMGMILRDEVDPVQLGAFLMLMRVKEESPDELTGFIEAVREQAEPPEGLSVDIDWSSYAGKRRHAPWFFFSVLLLAEAGFRVFIHGAEGHTPSRTYLTGVMADFGFDTAENWSSVSRELDEQGFSYLPLSRFAKRLAELIELRPILGLRSPVHSLSRLINPLDAPLVMQGIFHRPYSGLHQAAGENLRYPRVAVIRGEGGEIERAPDKPLRVYRAWSNGSDSGADEERWPPFFERRQPVPEAIRTEEMLAVWRGDASDEYGEAALVSTTALALYEAGRCDSQSEALELASALWAGRDRARFDSAPVAA